MFMSSQANFHRATLKNSEEMVDFKTLQSNDFQVILGRYESDGSFYIQSILFPKEKFSESHAQILAFALDSLFNKR